ncbi:DMT family transporter [Alphaproteobacteria bacterium LSUCC0684]
MKPLDYLLYGLTIFGWSTSWLALKWQLGVVAPEVSLFWRFSAAAILMFIITRALGKQIWIPLHQHFRIAGLGLCLFSLNFALFYYGGLNSTSGLLAVVFSLASVIIMLMVAALSRSWPRFEHLTAAFMGFCGVGLLYAPELQVNVDILFSLVLCIMGTLVFSTGNILSAAAQRQGMPVMATNCWGMVYGATYLGLYSFFRGDEFTVEPTLTYLGGLIWLVVISTVMSFTAYLMLVGRIGPGRAGYATAVFPVFALLISSVMEGYDWSLLALAGITLVAGGNVIMARIR